LDRRYCTTLVLGFITIGLHAEFPGDVAAIEQVRSDVQVPGIGQNEDVVGRAATWNEKIARFQRYNKLWYAAPCIPNGIDDIELIALPESSEEVTQ